MGAACFLVARRSTSKTNIVEAHLWLFWNFRHRHPSPTCLIRMAPTITDGSSVSYIIKCPAQHTIYLTSHTSLYHAHNHKHIAEIPSIRTSQVLPGNSLNSIKLKRDLSLSTSFGLEIGESIPPCFYSAGYGYTINTTNVTHTGWTSTLVLSSPGGPFGNDVKTLVVNATYETATRFHFKVSEQRKPAQLLHIYFQLFFIVFLKNIHKQHNQKQMHIGRGSEHFT